LPETQKHNNGVWRCSSSSEKIRF